MTIDYVINFTVPAISRNELPEKALSLMKDHHIRSLPVVDSGLFSGMLSDERLLTHLNKSRKPSPQGKRLVSSSVKNLVEKTSVHLTLRDSVYEALRLFSHTEHDLLPVLDVDLRYLGCVTERELVGVTGDLLSVNEIGCVLELNFSTLYYSVAEVIKIIEDNDARILSLNSLPASRGSDVHRIEIKLSVLDGSRIKSLLERAGYVVRLQGTDENVHEEELRERAQELLRFIEP